MGEKKTDRDDVTGCNFSGTLLPVPVDPLSPSGALICLLLCLLLYSGDVLSAQLTRECARGAARPLGALLLRSPRLATPDS